MIPVKNIRNDACYCLALEEYLLRNSSQEFFLLWHSAKPCVIVGKHQNALAEVNYPYIYANGINVYRRLSGGGTVFHGPGNLSFTFIGNGETGKLVDFKKHTAPITGFLQSLGIPATFEGKNNIRVNGYKVSGNAGHVYKNRVLHHGTLLYDADLDVLNESIRIQAGRYKDKSVQSIRSRVANIADYLTDAPQMDVFMEQLSAYLSARFGSEGAYALPEEDDQKVRSLAEKKYSQWEWNFSYSPAYSFHGKGSWHQIDMGIELQVKNGIITSAQIGGTGLPPAWLAVGTNLEGKRHEAGDVLCVLREQALIPSETNRLPDEWLEMFF